MKITFLYSLMKSFRSLLTLYVSNTPSIILLYADDCIVFQNWTSMKLLANEASANAEERVTEC